MSETTIADDVTIVPIGDVEWSTAESLFQSAAWPNRCNCQWQRQGEDDWHASSDAERRESLRQLSLQEVGPGLVAIRGGEVVAWCGVAPRQELSRLPHTRFISSITPEDLDTPGIWSVHCFVVRKEHRRQGLAHLLLDAAIRHAVEHGATVLEAYPIDTSVATWTTSANLNKGTLSLFDDAGFTEFARKPNGYLVVRMEV
jgi:GNAT superfamily N-acetyltransferase